MTDFKIKQNDTSPGIEAILKDSDNNPINLTGASLRFIMAKYNSTELKVDASATIVTAAEGLIKYDWIIGDTDESGTFKAEFEVTYNDGTIETFPNDGYLTIEIDPELG